MHGGDLFLRFWKVPSSCFFCAACETMRNVSRLFQHVFLLAKYSAVIREKRDFLSRFLLLPPSQFATCKREERALSTMRRNETQSGGEVGSRIGGRDVLRECVCVCVAAPVFGDGRR